MDTKPIDKKPKTGVVGLAGEYEVGFSEAGGLTDRCAAALAASGDVDVYNAGVVMYSLKSTQEAAALLNDANPDVLLVCVCTWSEDHHLLDLLALIERPVILWAFPDVESGSMCGVHQICSVLTELGLCYGHVYGAPEDDRAIFRALKYSDVMARARRVLDVSAESQMLDEEKAVALVKKMRTVRIGSVGGRIKGMTEIAFDEFEIIERTGARIVNIDEGELMKAAEAASMADAEAVFEKKGLGGYHASSPKEALLESMRYYLGMKALIDEYGLEGLVVKCYPKYMGLICLGYSLLSEEGIVCGCEGDANNTVLMKMLYELTGGPIHNTDILYADTDDNTMLFSHCGSGGFSLAASREEIDLGPVRLADSGVCALFTAKPGACTLANLVGRGGTMRLSVMTGQAVQTGMDFPGNPLRVRFEKDVLQINEEIAGLGVGHHWMAGYGDVSGDLEWFCELKGIPCIRI
ncbi:MAG: hypothetical protein FWG03_08605 [Clostridiales bacterium]|nr:hypothetical protein [Clostridiales bacterium]